MKEYRKEKKLTVPGSGCVAGSVGRRAVAEERGIECTSSHPATPPLGTHTKL